MKTSIPKKLHVKRLFINKLDINPKINRSDLQIDKLKELLTIKNMKNIFKANIEVVYDEQDIRKAYS